MANTPDELKRRARSQPAKIALVLANGDDPLSYDMLDRQADTIARAIRARGVEEGATIAMLMENDVDTVAWWWGARRAGVYYVPIGTRLLPHEIAYILEDCGAKAVVASRAHESLAREAVASAGVTIVPSEIALEGDAEPALAVQAEFAGREMIYSSGTTGRPKGVRRALTRADDTALPELEVRMRAVFGYGEDTVYLSVSPLYHATGRFLNRVIAAGGTVVILPRFDPEAALRAIETHRVTHSQWVPTMFRRMLDLPDETRNRFDHSSLRAALHAAAPCPVPLKRAMIDWWGPIVHEYYGGTENAGVTYIAADEWLAHPGSVGRCITGTIHILDRDDPERELPPSELGLITFSGGVPFRYTLPGGRHGDNTTPQGYSGYGDIGHVDQDGYLYISDRRDDLVLSGGVNIYPKEVEAALETCNAIREVAVIGVPDEDLGQIVCAVVVPADATDEHTARAVFDHARSRLSPIKAPRKIFVRNELPRSETGKLLKRVLRDEYSS